MALVATNANKLSVDLDQPDQHFAVSFFRTRSEPGRIRIKVLLLSPCVPPFILSVSLSSLYENLDGIMRFTLCAAASICAHILLT